MIYFHWEINIPCFDLVTSMPRKYFELLKSFVGKSVLSSVYPYYHFLFLLKLLACTNKQSS
jgi:hypothetical protein